MPHTNLGVLSREDLARLREVTASQGLMLESISERLMQTVHAGSPTKHPAGRLETIRAAGELQIPFTSGHPGGHRRDRGGADRLARSACRVHAEHGHIQEVILQNFVPHQRYYGQEPAEIADGPPRRVLAYGRRPTRGPRAAASRLGLSGDDRGHEAADRRDAPADAGHRHPGPTEPRRLVARAGRGRRDRPRGPRPTAITSRPSTRSPRPIRCARRCSSDGFALTERLCVYPQLHRPRVGRARA